MPGTSSWQNFTTLYYFKRVFLFNLNILFILDTNMDQFNVYSLKSVELRPTVTEKFVRLTNYHFARTKLVGFHIVKENYPQLFQVTRRVFRVTVFPFSSLVSDAQEEF